MFSELFIRKRNSLTDNGSTWVAVLSLGTCRCTIKLHTIQNRRHTTGMMKCTTAHRQREEIGSLTPCTCLIACLQELPLEKSAEISSLNIKDTNLLIPYKVDFLSTCAHAARVKLPQVP